MFQWKVRLVVAATSLLAVVAGDLEWIYNWSW